MKNHRPSSSIPKMERKVIEKNRRNMMKGLYAHLQSLLPNPGPNGQAATQLVDQIDEAVNYIERLKMEMEKYKEKKEHLLIISNKKKKKRPYSCIITSDEQDDDDDDDNIYNNNNLPSSSSSESTRNLPEIEIQQMSSSMDIILVKGLDNISELRDIVNLLHGEGGIEIISATFSTRVNSVFHILHEEKIGQSIPSNLRAKELCRRLKELFIGGAPSNGYIIEPSQESQLQLWNLDFEPSFWGFDLAEIVTTPLFAQ